MLDTYGSYYDPTTGQWVDPGAYDNPTYPSAPSYGGNYDDSGNVGVVAPAPAPATTTPAPSGGLSFPGGDPVAWAQAQLAGLPATTDSLIKIFDALKAAGVNVSRPTHGANNELLSDDKLSINGQLYDFIYNVGGADARWQFGPAGGGGGAGMPAIDPSFLAPYTEQFAAPGDAGLPMFRGPGAFKMPTAADLYADPGYLFEEGRIRDAITNSASAAGILNSTGTLDRIMSGVSDFARTGWNNLFNRQFNLWDADWQHSLDEYGLNTGRANTVYNRALGEYQDRRNMFYENEDRPWEKLMRGVDLGGRAAAA